MKSSFVRGSQNPAACKRCTEARYGPTTDVCADQIFPPKTKKYLTHKPPLFINKQLTIQLSFLVSSSFSLLRQCFFTRLKNLPISSSFHSNTKTARRLRCAVSARKHLSPSPESLRNPNQKPSMQIGSTTASRRSMQQIGPSRS